MKLAVFLKSATLFTADHSRALKAGSLSTVLVGNGQSVHCAVLAASAKTAHLLASRNDLKLGQSYDYKDVLRRASQFGEREVYTSERGGKAELVMISPDVMTLFGVDPAAMIVTMPHAPLSIYALRNDGKYPGVVYDPQLSSQIRSVLKIEEQAPGFPGPALNL